MELMHPVEVLARRVQSMSLQEGPLTVTSQSDGVPSSFRGRHEQVAPTCFWDLPAEIRHMIYRRACPGHYIDLQRVEALPLVRAYPRIRHDYLAHCSRDATFMLNLRNMHPEDRLRPWRDFLDNMSSYSAGQVRHMVFYFPHFVLKINIDPQSEERLSFDYTPDYDDNYDKQAVFNKSIIDKYTRRWISFKLIMVTTLFYRARLGQRDLNRIAKVAFELVPYLHLRLWPRQCPQHHVDLEGIADHAWECPHCMWTREMVD
ncbi:hypothetical protein BST61_g2245 [Cercospora zeina]